MKTVEERFWIKVSKSDGCWWWIGAKDWDGYGLIGIKGKTVVAHRLSWELHFGEIPEALCVLHRCDNPSCVNPGHLWLGSRADNNWDKSRKGRGNQPYGLSHSRPSAKLTEEDVLKIRSLSGTHDEIAKIFKVSRPTISLIKERKNWKHI